MEAAIASVFLIPLFLYLNRIRFRSHKKTVFYTLFAIYLSGVYAVAGLPNVTYVRFDPHFNFQPFLYMFSALHSSVLNVILFLPLGLFLYLLWKRFRCLGWNLLFGFCVSLSIEVLQIFTYRATDVNDLITNTFGTFLGWLFGCLATRCAPALKQENPESDLTAVFVSVVCVMFFLHPLLSAPVRSLLF